MPLDGELEFHLDKSPIERYEFTPEGFLRIHATIGRVGELIYVNQDGSERCEHVSADVLMHPDSIDSFCQKPITRYHPPGFVTPSNYTQYARGSTGQIATVGKRILGLAGVVGDREMIEDITSGRMTHVSSGYGSHVVKKDGRFCQTVRIGNHIAGLPEGRAGPECNFPHVTFKADGKDDPIIKPWILAEVIDPRTKARYFDMGAQRSDAVDLSTPPIQEKMKYELRHDGAILEVEDKAIYEMFKALEARSDSATKELEAKTQDYQKLRAEADALDAKLDAAHLALTAAQEAAKRADAVDMGERLTTLVRAMPGAKASGVTLDFNMDSATIKRAWVGAVHPEVSIAEKSDAYAEAYFDFSAPSFDQVLKFDAAPSDPAAQHGKSSPAQREGTTFSQLMEQVDAARSARLSDMHQDGNESPESYRDKARKRIEGARG